MRVWIAGFLFLVSIGAQAQSLTLIDEGVQQATERCGQQMASHITTALQMKNIGVETSDQIIESLSRTGTDRELLEANRWIFDMYIRWINAESLSAEIGKDYSECLTGSFLVVSGLKNP